MPRCDRDAPSPSTSNWPRAVPPTRLRRQDPQPHPRHAQRHHRHRARRRGHALPRSGDNQARRRIGRYMTDIRKLQSRGPPHRAGRRRPPEPRSDFWEGVPRHAVRRPSSPTSTAPPRATSTSIPATGGLSPSSPTRARSPIRAARPPRPGCVHHIAFSVSRVTFLQAVERLKGAASKYRGPGAAASWTRSLSTRAIRWRLTIELAASYRFAPAARLHARDSSCSKPTQDVRRARRLPAIAGNPPGRRHRDRWCSAPGRLSRSANRDAQNPYWANLNELGRGELNGRNQAQHPASRASTT